MNIRQAILNAHKVLTKNQIKSAGIDCEILLSKVLQSIMVGVKVIFMTNSHAPSTHTIIDLGYKK